MLFLILPLCLIGQIEHSLFINKIGSYGGQTILETPNGNLIIGALGDHPENEGDYAIWVFQIDSSTAEIINEFYFGEIGIYEELGSIQHTNDGGFVVSGRQGVYYPFLIKLNSMLEFQWEFTVPDLNEPPTSDGFSSIQLSNGNFLFLGNGQNDPVTRVYIVSNEGDLVVQDSINFHVNQAISDTDSSIVFVGQEALTFYDNQVLAVKTTNNLDVIWEFTYGDGIGADEGRSIIGTDDNGYLIAIAEDKQLPDHGIISKFVKIDSNRIVQNEVELFLGSPSYFHKGINNKYSVSASFEYWDYYSDPYYTSVIYLLNQEGEVECTTSHGFGLSPYNSTIVSSSTDILIPGSNGVNGIPIYRYDEECDLIVSSRNPPQRPNYSLFPNPVQEYLIIESDEPILKIVLFSSSGHKIIEQMVLGRNAEQLNMSNQESGLYFGLIHHQESVSTFKVLKL